MVDYGYYRRAKRQRATGSRMSLVLKIFDAVMLAASALCVILLLSAYLSKFISPERSAFFTFPGLFFPVIYVAGIFFTLYWVIRWKIYAVVMAALLLMGIGNVRLFYNLDLRQHYTENKPRKGELVVMSYNVIGFNPSYGTENKDPQQLIGELVANSNVDILCMQEFPGNPSRAREINAVIPELRYKYVVPYYEGSDDLALAIYSRYPVIAKGTVGEGQVRTIWADIRISRDTLRVVNNHLQSTTISGNDVDFVKRKFRVENASDDERLRGIFRKLADNYRKRAPQARRIEAFVKESPYQTIVCGDFNDTPASYVYRRVSRGMKDSFVEKGRGLTGTYNGFFNMFRIDYILMSKGLEVKNYYTFDEVYSDHNAVAASLEFIKK